MQREMGKTMVPFAGWLIAVHNTLCPSWGPNVLLLIEVVCLGAALCLMLL